MNLESLIIFTLGLIPVYVGAIVVEKYYTAFWTGFWNIYGLIVVTMAAIIGARSLSDIIIGVAIILCLIIILYHAIEMEESDVVRSIGSSIISSSFAWLIYVGFNFGIWLAILAFFLNSLFLFILIQAQE